MVVNSPLMAELVSFDPTVGITVVASIMLVLFMSVMVFLALAPVVSAEWAEKLNAVSDGNPGADANTAD